MNSWHQPNDSKLKKTPANAHQVNLFGFNLVLIGLFYLVSRPNSNPDLLMEPAMFCVVFHPHHRKKRDFYISTGVKWRGGCVWYDYKVTGYPVRRTGWKMPTMQTEVGFKTAPTPQGSLNSSFELTSSRLVTDICHDFLGYLFYNFPAFSLAHKPEKAWLLS